MWGQHLAYGKPFAGPGCIIRLPDDIQVITERVDDPDGRGRVQRSGIQSWPVVLGPNGENLDLSVLPDPETASDIVYLSGFRTDAWYTVENPSLGLGVKVAWDSTAFPYLWFWQEFGGTKHYPWYGRHYNIGLEPFSSYPTHGIHRAVENGSAQQIAGHGKRHAHLTFTPFLIDEEE